jgi:hypothetical protein
VGAFEAASLGVVEATLKYHPWFLGILTRTPESGAETVSDGQFDWGGSLLKCNGGAQRYPQRGRQSRIECKGIRVLNCKIDKSSRCESRA